MIEFIDVSKDYGEVRVLENLDLKIGRGEFVCLVGPSGGGKTTLLKMVNGLIMPSAGEVIVNGIRTSEADLVELRRKIGYAIQGSVLFPHMSVKENIAYVPRLWNGWDRSKTDAAVRKWMGIVGLDEELLERFPAELSGGQAQRVGIARALAASPDILLMDEPFGAVDEITRAQLQTELRRIFDETRITVLFVTHDMKEAARLGTKIAVVADGGIQQYDEPRVLIERPATPFIGQLVSGL